MRRTKEHLFHILSQLESKDAIDVSQLLKALQTALRFEQEMEVLFEPIFASIGLAKRQLAMQRRGTSSSASDAGIDAPDGATGYDVSSPDARAKTIARLLALIPEGLSGMDQPERLFMVESFLSLKGEISRGFDRFLGSYVVLEKNNLADLLKRLGQDEDITQSTGTQDNVDTTASTEQGHVYGSSVSMFVFIKNSIKRCTTFSTGQTFFALSKEFRLCLGQYADMLRTRCPPLVAPPTLFTTAMTTAPSPNPNYFPHPLCKLPVGQESLVCYLINTGEYCGEVVPQLEQMVKNKMSEQYRDKVDYTVEADTFNDLVSLALKTLVGATLDRLEPAFKAITAQNWAADTQV